MKLIDRIYFKLYYLLLKNDTEHFLSDWQVSVRAYCGVAFILNMNILSVILLFQLDMKTIFFVDILILLMMTIFFWSRYSRSKDADFYIKKFWVKSDELKKIKFPWVYVYITVTLISLFAAIAYNRAHV